MWGNDKRRARQDPVAALDIGFRHSRGGNPDKAVEIYRIVVQTGHPTAAPRAALRLGLLLRRRGDRGGAEQALRFAADSGEPDSAAQAKFSLGGLFADDPPRAILAYQQAIETGHPEMMPSAALCLGEVYEDSGRYEAAAAAYQQAIDSGHADCAPKAAFSLGRLRRTHLGGDADAAFRMAADSGHPEASAEARRALGEAPPVAGWTIQFKDAQTGQRVAADRGLLDALLMQGDRPDLVGANFVSGWTADGAYAITFPGG